jgi:hypothetical protein
VIVGAGIAGMSAALRLLEADFDVTVIEKSAGVGGKFGAMQVNGAHHEHAYHFLSDWCLNFWDVAASIEVFKDEHFVPRNSIKFLRPRPAGRPRGRYAFNTLTHGAAQMRFWENVHAGVIPPDDMIAYTYSLLDLVTDGGDDDPDELEFLNRVSVNGFMRSRTYMTDLAALLHQEAMLKAFAVPSYETSVRSYRTFVRYFGRDTGGWILKGDSDTAFWAPFRRRLARFGDRYRPLMDTSLEDLEIASDRDPLRVRRILVHSKEGNTWMPIDPGHLILAVPYQQVVRLVERNDTLRAAVPRLLEMRKLRERQMASLDLYFSQPLEGIPSEHVTLINDRGFGAAGRAAHLERRLVLADRRDIASRYALSFVDNFQAWYPERPRKETWLNVVAADFDELAGLDCCDARDAIVKELQEYLDFELTDVDWDRTMLRLNADAPLFMNTVGSWQYRPETRTDDLASYREHWVHSKVTNMYLAGDYCRSKIDLVSLEGAVTTGIAAARAVAKNARREDRVKEPLVPPEVSPRECERLKMELAPVLAEVARRRGRR